MGKIPDCTTCKSYKSIRGKKSAKHKTKKTHVLLENNQVARTSSQT